ncbi:substrate-binding domain-containing protein [Plebeiibacterium sediminum]|uniref:histidine kinase n=1 Tax=Plebeiibacterium sediminum TaxID=2992112 RepID=A0AAE3M714_9BACT|nr:substrate-binding domain-containing protein [Plebeiobacterium sediminum]MCW3788288.1 substrate-binding domain-containing protein [Plebeiobacterium sediminum]
MGKKLILVIIVVLFSFTSFAQKIHRIAFSQCSSGDWRQQMEKEMQQELMFHPDLELTIKYAGDNTSLQIQQINELVTEGIDLLIIAPIEIEAVKLVVEDLYKKGIPVVLIDRKIESDKYTAYVGGNNFLIGYTAGMYIADILNKHGDVIEILGALSSSPAKERMQGFEDALIQNTGISIVDRIYSNWSNQVVLDSLSSCLKANPNVDAIFAHADFLAAAASEVITREFSNRNIKIIGVDGSPSVGGGVELVENHVIDATLIYPTGGKEAIILASKILSDSPFKKNNLLPTTLIDERNVKITRLQYNNIENLQNDIARSKGMLDLLGGRYKKQQLLLFITLFSFALVVVLIFLLFKAYKNKKNANQSLEEQKEAISKQNNELTRMSDQLKEATQARMQFYTNISHEFRTPLTLIVGPLENIIKTHKTDEVLNQELKTIYSNSLRLLRLVDQIMDFRKIETTKMKLKVGHYNLDEFMHSIKKAFLSLSTEKQIDVEVVNNSAKLSLWFDWDKMDKVMFNLMSNAFKYTAKGGSIQIILDRLSADDTEDYAKIEVKDNGEGIPQHEVEKIFDRFYQADSTVSYKGTGIGLSLTKELVLLHKGKITVESKLGEGTSFKILLPLGKKHFAQDEILSDAKMKEHPVMVDFTEFEQSDKLIEDITKETSNTEGEKPLLLIVEDEPDIRKYIKSCFSSTMYSIMEAKNGKEGLKLVETEGPDIIISDVMMPVMDGLELTRKVKSDLRYCHIPMILLTAKSSLEHLLEGLEEGADSYIAKPFNKEHLQVRVKKLLQAEAKMREKYQEPIKLAKEEKGMSRMDKNFLSKISNVIIDNKLDSKVNVEELSHLVGLSRVHLYRKIKKITGLSVSEFVTQTKLKQSLTLLKNTDSTIAEIAYKVGFSTPSYFTKCFKDHFEISPSDYRESI